MSDTTDDYRQQELWGLDYYLRVYNKMYICDVKNLKIYPHHQEVFAYKNHPIYKVDVLGVVVGVEERDRCFIYALDDGTGVISCCCWKADSIPLVEGSKYSTLPSSLQQKLSDLRDEEEISVSGYTHGDLVHVKGKVKVFREVNEVTAVYHAKINNPTAETVRMMELPKLYRQCYDKPFELPYKVQQELEIIQEETRTGIKSERRIIQEVSVAIQEHLRSKPSMREFLANHICRIPEIRTILNQQQSPLLQSQTQNAVSLVTQALQSLEEDHGIVCRRMEAKAYYENLQPRCALDDSILKVLVREAQKPKYAEKGCHYLHLLDELHKTVQYSKLHRKALLYCLQKLETQSDVIRTYHKQYLPCVT